jgi:hypothetical protein
MLYQKSAQFQDHAYYIKISAKGLTIIYVCVGLESSGIFIWLNNSEKYILGCTRLLSKSLKMASAQK